MQSIHSMGRLERLCANTTWACTVVKSCYAVPYLASHYRQRCPIRKLTLVPLLWVAIILLNQGLRGPRKISKATLTWLIEMLFRGLGVRWRDGLGSQTNIILVKLVRWLNVLVVGLVNGILLLLQFTGVVQLVHLLPVITLYDYSVLVQMVAMVATTIFD